MFCVIVALLLQCGHCSFILHNYMSSSISIFGVGLSRNAIVFGNLVEEWGSIISHSRWLADTKSASINLRRCLRQQGAVGIPVSFRHVSRDGNKVADTLAKLASPVSFNIISFDAPPVAVVDLLHEDQLLL
ncbi:hypothetical protein V6N13_033399 [Hibiscus sabdariffa]